MAPLLVKILNLTDGNTKARDMNWRVATEEDVSRPSPFLGPRRSC